MPEKYQMQKKIHHHQMMLLTEPIYEYLQNHQKNRQVQLNELVESQ